LTIADSDGVGTNAGASLVPDHVELQNWSQVLMDADDKTDRPPGQRQVRKYTLTGFEHLPRGSDIISGIRAGGAIAMFLSEVRRWMV